MLRHGTWACRSAGCECADCRAVDSVAAYEERIARKRWMGVLRPEIGRLYESAKAGPVRGARARPRRLPAHAPGPRAEEGTGGDRMRLYVSGPVTGVEGRNRAAFEAAARELSSRLRYAVEIPHDTVPSDADWIEAMRVSLRAMLGCDGVAMLPGWQRSAGARLEQSVAVAVGMECHTVAGWLRRERR